MLKHIKYFLYVYWKVTIPMSPFFRQKDLALKNIIIGASLTQSVIYIAKINLNSAVC